MYVYNGIVSVYIMYTVEWSVYYVDNGMVSVYMVYAAILWAQVIIIKLMRNHFIKRNIVSAFPSALCSQAC